MITITPVSLLERLRQPADRAAWDRLVELYTPLLCDWTRRLGLQESDAADLVQDVFTILVQKLPEFTYDRHKSFRGWLWTVTVNKCREMQRRRTARARSADTAALGAVSVPDTTEAIDEAEYRQYLVRRAMELMRSEFQPASWQAFWECVVNERPAAEVAGELGLSENAVYLAKGRVLRRLRRELEGLLD
ncbi:MAG: sigma-70 family RNA polymerase sigma factor [Planctomycetes bacterium]|nr:sigma-70 family RNA polymerase sigma factor [Planctomycetota bacterium]